MRMWENGPNEDHPSLGKQLPVLIKYECMNNSYTPIKLK